MRILITGVPGSGKTDIGDYLNTDHDFYHLNMELDGITHIQEFIDDPTVFFQQFNEHSNVVVTWGFSTAHTERIQNGFLPAGFKWFWFDGNREASLSAFRTRTGDDPMARLDYNTQIANIANANLPDTTRGMILYNPFDSSGTFKERELIVTELLEL